MISFKKLFKKKPKYDLVTKNGITYLYDGDKLVTWGENLIDILTYIQEHTN